MSNHSLSSVNASATPAIVPQAGSVLLRQGVTELKGESLKEPQPEAATRSRPAARGAAAPPPADGGRGPLRDFARLDVRPAARNIRDDDVVRAMVTRWLVEEIAPLLGLDPARIEVRVNADAESRTNARGASGLMEEGTIYLHPARYHPRTASGHHLLAHEAVHVAQRQITRAACRPDATAIERAEREANHIASAIIEHRPTERPRQALPRLASAAQTAAATAAAPVADLKSLVERNYAREMEEIRDALSTSFLDWAVTDGDIEKVLRILEPFPFPTKAAMIGALTQELQDHFVDNIDKSHFQRFRSSILAGYYAAVDNGLAAKLQSDPFKGMNFTGLQPEEHFALYHIIPAFMETGKGKAWYTSLSDKDRAHVDDVRKNIPTYDVKDERKKATEAEEKRQAERQESAKLIKADDVQGFLKQAREALTYKIADWAVTDSEALSVIDGFAAFSDDPARMRTIVEALESEGLMGRLVDNLPVEAIYTDVGKTAAGKNVNRRKVFLQVLAFRPARENAKKAEELLSYGLFDWAITDEEAYLASQLVKALPPSAREGFYAEQGGKFVTRLDEEMSLSMKKGKTANYYMGGEGGTDLRSIQAQLLEDALWSKEQMTRLRMLIQMAVAAGEGAWVFAQSRERYLQGKANKPTQEPDSGQKPANPMQELYQDREFFSRIVEAMRLYVPKGFRRPDGVADQGREEYEPARVEGKPLGTDNKLWLYLIEGIGFLHHSKRIQIFKESIGGEGLDFGEFQDMMGGSFMGAEFRRASAAEGFDKEELLDNSARLDLDHGVLELRASRLDVVGINFPMTNFKFQTGETKVSGLHLHMEYPSTATTRTTTTIRLRVDALELNDVLLISPDSMVGFAQISLKDFFIDLFPSLANQEISGPSEDFAYGNFFLTPLYNILKIGGAIDELRKGLLEPTNTLNLTVTAGQILLKGMTTSGGQYIDSTRLDDLTVRSFAPEGRWGYLDRLNDEKKRLEWRISVIKSPAAEKGGEKPLHHIELETERSLTLQLNSVIKEIANIKEAEEEQKRLKQLQQAGQLSAADERKLKRVTAYLKDIDAGGMAVDVGHTEIHGISGRVKMGDVTLDEIHGYGHSAGAALGFLADSYTLGRMLRGPEYRGTIAGVDQEGDPTAFIKIGNIEANAIEVQGKVPTVMEAEEELKKLGKEIEKSPTDLALQAQKPRLEKRLALAIEYWNLVKKDPDKAASEDPQKDRDRFEEIRKFFVADVAFKADRIALKGAVLDLMRGEQGTEVAVEAAQLDAFNLQAHELIIKEAHATNLSLRAGVAGGLSNLVKIAKNPQNLTSAGIAADRISLQEIAHQGSGVGLKQLNIENLAADMARGKGEKGIETTGGVKATTIEVIGGSWALTEQLLLVQQQKLQEKAEAKRTDKERQQLSDIAFLLDAIKSSADRLKEAEAQMNDPLLSPSARTAYEEQRKQAREELAFWQRKAELKRLTIADLNVGLKGLGDVFAEDFSVKSALKAGVTAYGRGENQQIASGITGEGAWMRLGVGSTKETAKGGMQVSAGSRAGVDYFETGPIRGSVEYALDHIDIKQFIIEKIDVTRFAYYGDETGIWSDDLCSIGKILVDARVETPLVDNNQPEGDRYMSQVTLREFQIDFIKGRDLHYKSYKSGLKFDLTAGKVRDIFARGVKIDLPKDETGHLKIHGGTAGVAALENAQVAVTTASGLAFNGLLNAESLSAEFLETGAMFIDLKRFNLAGGHITQGDLDAEINAKGGGIHVEVIPGSAGYANSTQKFRAADLEASAKGHKGTTKFDVAMKSGYTGDIVRQPDGTIDAPAVHLPEIHVNQLSFENEKIKVEVPAGQTIDIVGTEINVRLEANPTPEDKRAADESGFSRILIRRLGIFGVLTRGMTVVLKEKGITITLPEGVSGSIKDIALEGDESHPEGFIIEPNKHWAMLGKLGASEMNFFQMGADVGKLVIERANIGAKGLKVGFISDGTTELDLEEVTAENIMGKLKAAAGGKDSRFSVLTGMSRWKDKPSAVKAKGIHYGKDGLSVKEISLDGFKYRNDDLGLTIDIQSARALQKGPDDKLPIQYTDKGTIKVPRAEIDNAFFQIDDLMNMKTGGGDKGPASDLDFGPDWDFFDKLDGHVNFLAEIITAGGSLFTADIKVLIDQGKVNFSKIKDKRTDTLVNAGVDIQYKKPEYGGAIPPRLSLLIIPLDEMWWDLDPQEAYLAEKDSIVRISTFFKHPMKTPPTMPWHKPTKEAGLGNVYFGDIDISLSLQGGTVIKLGNAGRITLGGGAAPGFRIEAKNEAVPAFTVPIAKLKALVESIDLKLDQKGGYLRTGAITISGLQDGELTLETGGIGPVYKNDAGEKSQNKMNLPKRLSGVLTKATLENLELQLPQEQEAKKGAAQ